MLTVLVFGSGLNRVFYLPKKANLICKTPAIKTIHSRTKSESMVDMKALSVQYSPSTVEVKKLSSLKNIQHPKNGDTVFWLDVSEYKEVKDLLPLHESFGLHTLALEDCIHIRQRPKIDEFDDNIFLTCRTVQLKGKRYVEGHQLGIFLGKDFVITVHKEHMPQLDEILEDIQKMVRHKRIEKGSSSFLMYAILDTIVDNLEDAVRQIEEMETIVGDDVLKEPPPENVLDAIYTNRSNLLLISRLLRPQSHVVSCILKGDFQLVNGETAPFFRDIYDHALRTHDRIESLLDLNIGSLSIYGSSVSNRMNQVMKLLTVISTIGVPLTILVGWYGMNFRDMPEIYWAYGYLAVILMAVGIISLTILLFRRKRWL
jgi:magnesium transporter